MHFLYLLKPIYHYQATPKILIVCRYAALRGPLRRGFITCIIYFTKFLNETIYLKASEIIFARNTNPEFYNFVKILKN